MSKTKNDRSVKITTPSFYGSHASMVVDSEEFDVQLAQEEVICKDDTHYYITTRNRLDTGLADPKRYSFKQNLVKKKQPEETKEE